MSKTKSKKMSLEGWNFWAWFSGNWKTIKELLKVGVPAAAGWLITNGNPEWSGAITIVGKFLLDMGEYWYKEYA